MSQEMSIPISSGELSTLLVVSLPGGPSMTVPVAALETPFGRVIMA